MDGTQFVGNDVIDVTTVIRQGKARPVVVEVSVVTQVQSVSGSDRFVRSTTKVFDGELGQGEHRLPAAIRLPNGPFSFEGKLLHVMWFVVATVRFDGSSSRSTNTFIHVNYRPSAHPIIQPHRPGTALSGFSLTAKEVGAVAAAVMMMTFGLVLGGVAAMFVQSLWVLAAAAALSVTLAGSFVGNPVRRAVAERTLRSLRIELEPPVPAPGQTVRAVLSFQPERDLSIRSGHLRISCVEKTTVVNPGYPGIAEPKEHVWRSAMVDISDIVGDWTEGEPCRVESTFQLPDEAPVSFQVGNSEVVWNADVAIQVEGHKPQTRTKRFVVAQNPRLLELDERPVVAV